MLVVFTTAFSFSALAAESVYQNRGLAIKGYDPVAYFTEDNAVQGDKKFSHEYKGATWIFSSQDNLDLFKEDPAAYTPKYNGYCAYAMGEYGKKVKVDPRVYTIKDGKLYLNFNKKIGDRFNDDIDRYIADGDTNWEKIISE